jgi:hypothetical protein
MLAWADSKISIGPREHDSRDSGVAVGFLYPLENLPSKAVVALYVIPIICEMGSVYAT